MKRFLATILMIGMGLSLFLPHVSWAVNWGNFESNFPGLGGKSIDDFAKNKETGGIIGLVNVIIQVAIGVIVALGVIVIMVSGFMYMAAEGDEGKIATAKSLLVGAAYGITFALLAQLILNTISTQFAGDLTEPFRGR